MATTRGERLRMAREKRFKSARLAGKALGIPVSTYGAHERAQSPGGRDYGPEDAKKYARRFGVTPEWLLTGREPFPTGADESPAAPKVPVVGYVGAGSAAHLYDVAQPHLDDVGGPSDDGRPDRPALRRRSRRRPCPRQTGAARPRRVSF